ncbi:MAG: LytTR family transcriptional regulator DNA-binding domain-containing protein [Oscillospiraceae bacterium]|nr:LytTR family transcriptional regulator DNA-binding domain-containing protein [Oscillospiraceae bacterium]
MRFIKTKEKGIPENYLELHYDEIDDETREYISRIDKTLTHIEGTCDGMRVTVPVSDVLYFESVDRRTFAYTESRTVEFRTSLNKLLDSFGDIGFIRISKSAVVNVYKIDRLQGDLNMRVIIFLKNGEKLIMNRGYRKEFFEELERIRGKNKA